MAKKSEISKSEEVRQFLKAHRRMKTKDVVAGLAEKGVKVKPGLVYFIKGQLKGKRGRRKKARQLVAKVAATNGHMDPLGTILKIKGWASEVGGMKKLKELVDALSD
jgi:hypothetical protein